MEVLERLIGKPEAISAAAGYEYKAAYAWRLPSKWRDAGDLPSARVMRAILRWTAERGIPLEHRHLIEGATEAEVAQLLASMPRGEAAA